MDDKLIFQGNTQASSTPALPANPAPDLSSPGVSPSAPTVQAQRLAYPENPTPVQPQSSAPPPPPPPNESILSNFSFGKILKIGIGIIVVIFFLFLIFGVVLPHFHKPTSEKITLTYWGLWEDERIMQSVISDFQRQHPDITVEYSKQDPKQYRQRLTTRINNGTGPDIFRFHNTWYPMLSSVLLPLPDSAISKDQFSKNYYPTAGIDLIKNGAIYGIPIEMDTLALYINTDILKSAGLSAPISWEDFRNDAQTFTVKGTDGKIKTAGAAIGSFDNVSHAPDIISLLFVQNAADMTNFTGSTKQVSDALKFYTSFNSNVWDSTLDPSILNFSKGSVAMIFGYSWDYFNIKALNPNLAFEIVPVPQLDKNNPITIASYWAEGASVKSKHQKEAATFLSFLADKTVQQKIYTEESKTRFFGEPYSNVSLGSTLKDDSRIYPFIQQSPHAVSSYFVDSTQDDGLNTKLNAYLQNGVNSILNNNTSPESATATLFQGYDQVLKEYGQ